MHIPDGFLSPGMATVLLGVAASFFIHAWWQVRRRLLVEEKQAVLATTEGLELSGKVKTRFTKYGREKIWRMASVAAFVFAAQMINFPVAEGTSGHLLGGVLAAILLGPLEGFLVIAIILIVQSLVFADGGLVALGANIFNMGIVGAIGGYYFYKFLFKYLKKMWLAAFIAAWTSVVVAASFCAVELAISGTETINIVLPAMAGIHVLIGLGEGIITVLVLLAMKYKEKTNE
ncbi:energy-coupling factor ABC transporter permease [Patescibacteria group bacterium]|nr:energy-coupling factor ABC transporter permease [Patescibacteria group bacterium]